MYKALFLFFLRTRASDCIDNDWDTFQFSCMLPKFLSTFPPSLPPLPQGVVTASCSLLEEFARINSLGFSECVNAAVIRLSRVSHSLAKTRHSSVRRQQRSP